jgi:hypothetical protein
VTKFTPSEFCNVLEFTESGKTYRLYDNSEDKENLDANWFGVNQFHLPDSDITLNMCPIGGISNNKTFGVPLKQTYKFEEVKYGIDDAHFLHNVDPEGQFGGVIKDPVKFDFGKKIKQDGNDAMLLRTHNYTVLTIDEAECQSHFDLNFGTFQHKLFFNTPIEIEKIYRIDVSYCLSNSEPRWYEFWVKTDRHDITKSFTAKKVKGGIFNLSTYSSFSEGVYRSTRNSSTTYKYCLLLNYTDDP